MTPKMIEALMDRAGCDAVCAGEGHNLLRAANEILEAAARVCEQKVRREAGYNGQFEGYGAHDGYKTGPECAADIRALKLARPDWATPSPCDPAPIPSTGSGNE